MHGAKLQMKLFLALDFRGIIMLDFFKNNFQAIIAVVSLGSAVVVPIIVALINKSIKDEGTRALIPGIAKGAVDAIGAVTDRTSNKVDDVVHLLLRYFADELIKTGASPTVKNLQQAASVASSVEGSPKLQSLVDNAQQSKALIEKLRATTPAQALAAIQAARKAVKP